MKKSKRKDEPLVQTDREAKKPEKLWLVSYFTVRRHSRVLYLPLDAVAVRLHDIQKGDIVKAVILELRKGPRADDPLREPKDEGELLNEQS
jgi:hypothetical protein